MKVESLPESGAVRWCVRRKAQVVNAVRKGTITLAEACARYAISEPEFRSWESLLDRHGPQGLRASRIQEYRPAAERLAS